MGKVTFNVGVLSNVERNGTLVCLKFHVPQYGRDDVKLDAGSVQMASQWFHEIEVRRSQQPQYRESSLKNHDGTAMDGLACSMLMATAVGMAPVTIVGALCAKVIGGC